MCRYTLHSVLRCTFTSGVVGASGGQERSKSSKKQEVETLLPE